MTVNGFLDLTWNLMVAAVVVFFIVLAFAGIHGLVKEREQS
jgi:hypothetical protein